MNKSWNRDVLEDLSSRTSKKMRYSKEHTLSQTARLLIEQFLAPLATILVIRYRNQPIGTGKFTSKRHYNASIDLPFPYPMVPSFPPACLEGKHQRKRVQNQQKTQSHVYCGLKIHVYQWKSTQQAGAIWQSPPRGCFQLGKYLMAVLHWR